MALSYEPAKVRNARGDARRHGIPIPKEGRHGENVIVRHAVAADPNPARQGKDQLVAVNVRHDMLENEWARRRISLPAYMAGRCYQGTWDERESSSPFSERVDSMFVSDLGIINMLDWARHVVEMRDDAKKLLGKDREVLLNRILMENMTVEQTDKRRAYYVLETFRQSLEILGEAWFCTNRS